MPENRQKTGRKATRTSFQPGKSGNPGGRPKQTPEEKAEERALHAACRDKTEEALATIVLLMNKADKDSVRLAAAIFVIERGWGKAVSNTASWLKLSQGRLRDTGERRVCDAVAAYRNQLYHDLSERF